MSTVHKSAVLSSYVELGENVCIGPNCTIGLPGYQLGGRELTGSVKRTVIGNHSIIFGNSVICQGSTIGHNCRLDYHSFVGERTAIGNFCVVELGARIYDDVQIADYSTISGFVCNGCTIEENSIVQGDLIHRFNNVRIGEKEKPPSIGPNCFVGRKALVIGPIKIADGTYIAAGSIVLRDTKPNMFYIGVPAKKAGVAPKAYLSSNAEFNKLRSFTIDENIFGNPSPER